MRTVDEIQLKDNDRAAIRDAVRVLRAHFPVDRVILFGSKARGTDNLESDIDLLVLTSRQLGWRERDAITDALFDVELASDVVIDTLVVPTSEWNEGLYRVLPIRGEIESFGVAA